MLTIPIDWRLAVLKHSIADNLTTVFVLIIISVDCNNLRFINLNDTTILVAASAVDVFSPATLSAANYK